MLIFWQFMIQFSRVEMSGLVAKKVGYRDEKGNILLLKEKVLYFLLFLTAVRLKLWVMN